MPTYPSSVPGTESSKFGTMPDFFNDFGCACDGVTDDTVKAQAAIDAVSAAGRVQYIYIPHGKSMAVVQLNIPSNIIISGYGPNSKLIFVGSKPTGVGRLDFAAGVNNSGLENFTIVGLAATSTGVDYASITSPIQASLSDGTTVWFHGGTGSGECHLRRIRITNTEGYSVLLDATTGSMSGYTVRECRFYDNRPHTFGVSGSFIYGSWTGGIHYESDGTLYSVDDVLVDSCRFHRMSGHCFWGHAAAFAKLNTNIRFINNTSQDTALDVVEIGVTNGYQVTNNRMSRVGYLSSANGIAGVPKWGTVPPICIDHTGTCINGVVSDNVMDAVNGGAFDCDGMAQTIITANNCTSSWASADPLADSAHCGPLGTGSNVSAGVNLGNSTWANGSNGGADVGILGNRLDGFGAGAIRFYAGRRGKINGNTIYHPANATVQPIIGGPLASATGNVSVTNGSASVNYVSGTVFPTFASGAVIIINGIGYHVSFNTSTVITLTTVYTGATSGSTGFVYSHYSLRCADNDISSNSIFWQPASTGAGILEDGSNAPFAGFDTNLVYNNSGAGNFFEFYKDPKSSSTTGAIKSTSVSAVATAATTGNIVGTIYQTEGVSIAAHSIKEYRSDGLVLRTSTITTTDIPSLTISGNGCISNTRDFIGRSLSIFPIPYTLGGHSYVKHDEVYDGVNIQIALNAGTGGASAPSWNPTVGANTLDNGGGPTGVTWKNLGPPVSVSGLRDGYLRSLTIDGFGLVIDDNGNYLGPASLSPPVVIGSTAYTTTGNALTVLTGGAFNNLDECVPIVALMDTGSASMRDLTNFFQPYQAGHLVGSREAIISAGGRNKVGSTNWELDGLRVVLVNDNPAQFNASFGGFYQGNTVVCASMFAVNLAAPVSGNLGTVFALNSGLADFGATLSSGVIVPGTTPQQSILIHHEMDNHVGNSGTVVRGLTCNVTWYGGGIAPIGDWNAYEVDDGGASMLYGFVAQPNSCVIGLQLFTARSSTDSIPIQMVSGASLNSRIYADSTGRIVLKPDIAHTLGHQACFATISGFDAYAYSIGSVAIVTNARDIFGHSYNIDVAGYSVGTVIDQNGNHTGNSFTLHSAFANILSIDNTNTATFAQLKMSDGVHTQVAIGPVNSLGYSNTNFSLVTCIGVQVGSNSGITGGAPGGFVNVNAGYMINGQTLFGSTGVITTGTLNCTTLNVSSLTFSSLTVTGTVNTAGITLSTGYIVAGQGFQSPSYEAGSINIPNGGAIIGPIVMNTTVPTIDIGNKIEVKGQSFPSRTNSTFYAAGMRIIVSGVVYTCISSGSSASSQPGFNPTVSSLTFDGSVIWQSAGTYVGYAYYVASDVTGSCRGYFGATSGGAFMGTFTANTFGVRTQNIDRIQIAASGGSLGSNAGYVGIGTSPPNTSGFVALAVNGQIQCSGAVFNGGISTDGITITGGFAGVTNPTFQVNTPSGVKTVAVRGGAITAIF